MAIKFPDSITQNNSNYITVSATDGDVQGIYFVDTIAERDAIGGSDYALDNHRVEGAVVYVGTEPYVYIGSGISDIEWADPLNWVIGNAGVARLGDINNVNIMNLGVGHRLEYDGNNWVNYAPGTTVAVTGGSSFQLDAFSVNDYNGAIYSYLLLNPGNGARTGQLMIVHDNGAVEMTDNSTNTLGTATPQPEFVVAIESGDVVVRIDNANGYTFKAEVTKL